MSSARIGAPRRLGVLELLQHQDAGAFAEDEAVAALVERSRGALGVVVAGGERAHRGESADERFVDAGLGAAGDHHVGVAAPDRLGCLADGVAAGRAGRHRREVRAGHAEADRDLARADVRDAHRDEERADPIGSASGVDRDALDERANAAEAGAEDHAGPLGLVALEAFRQAGLVHRLARGDQPELDVAVGPADLLAIEDVGRVEVADLAGDLRRSSRDGSKAVDGRDPGATGDQAIPRRRDVVAERRDACPCR